MTDDGLFVVLRHILVDTDCIILWRQCVSYIILNSKYPLLLLRPQHRLPNDLNLALTALLYLAILVYLRHQALNVGSVP